jgi:hypothetical protein
MTFSSMVICKVSLAQLLIPMVAVQIKRKSSVYIPYVKGVSEKFKHIENQYNIRTIFKTKHTLKEFTHKNQAANRSAMDGTVHL